MKKKILLSPSILAGDFSEPRKEFAKLKKYHVPYLHCDIMDGNFVPNISFGPEVIKSFIPHVRAELDVHLMIADADKFIDEFIALKPAFITFHVEAVRSCLRLIKHIQKNRIKAGVALNPGTSLASLNSILPYIDLVLVMTVDPGFYGQPYIKGMEKKVLELYNTREKKGYKFLIEVDGGIDKDTIPLLKDHVDMAVTGKAFFRNPDLAKFMKQLDY